MHLFYSINRLALLSFFLAFVFFLFHCRVMCVLCFVIYLSHIVSRIFLRYAIHFSVNALFLSFFILVRFFLFHFLWDRTQKNDDRRNDNNTEKRCVTHLIYLTCSPFAYTINIGCSTT